MTDASSAIVAGPALDTWFTAHQAISFRRRYLNAGE
jgi:hypothetical protein